MKKEIVIRPDTPYEELGVIVIVSVVGAMTLMDLFNNSDRHVVVVLLCVTCWTGFLYMIWLTNKRFKQIIIKEDWLTIKSYLSLVTRQFKKLDLRGYQLIESYHGNGTVWVIQIVTKDEEKIQILSDGYRNYNMVTEKIKNSGLIYLGRTELNGTRKRIYSWVMTWGVIIIPFTIALIVYLVKDK